MLCWVLAVVCLKENSRNSEVSGQEVVDNIYLSFKKVYTLFKTFTWCNKSTFITWGSTGHQAFFACLSCHVFCLTFVGILSVITSTCLLRQMTATRQKTKQSWMLGLIPEDHTFFIWSVTFVYSILVEIPVKVFWIHLLAFGKCLYSLTDMLSWRCARSWTQAKVF